MSPFSVGEMERGAYLARNDKCDGLDEAGGELVRARDLAVGGANRAPWDKAHTALRVARLVLVQRVQVVVLILKVSDIAVALPSYQKQDTHNGVSSSAGDESTDRKEPTEEENVVVAPKGHHDARGLVECERLDALERPSLPHANLAIAHTAKPGRRDAVAVAHPHDTSTLDTAVALAYAHGVSARTRVEKADLAIARRGGEELASGVERDALDGISVTDKDGLGDLGGTKIPELDGVVANGAREDVLSGRVP